MPQTFKLFSQRLKYLLSGSLQKMKNISLRVFRNFTIIKLLAALLKNGLGLKEALKRKEACIICQLYVSVIRSINLKFRLR